MTSPLIALQASTFAPEMSQRWQGVTLALNLGRVAQSMALAYEIVRQDPTQQQRYQTYYLEALRLGAEFAEEIRDYRKALFYWEQLLQQVPHNAEAYYGLGIAKANLQDYRGAEAALRQAIQLEPTNQRMRSRLQEIQNLR